MHTSEEDGIANEGIVLQWPLLSASWDFKVVKKQWAVHCSVQNAVILWSHNF